MLKWGKLSGIGPNTHTNSYFQNLLIGAITRVIENISGTFCANFVQRKRSYTNFLILLLDNQVGPVGLPRLRPVSQSGQLFHVII